MLARNEPLTRSRRLRAALEGGADSPPRLNIEHLEMLRRSGVGQHPALERSYRSATAEEVAAVGFAPQQARSGLLIPMCSPWGELHYQIRPDVPRTDSDGRAVKYETPAGREPHIDLLPRHHDAVLRRGEPCIITEGAKKGDCIASSGWPAVVLTGVWNWGRKREEGGVKRGKPQLLPDWDAFEQIAGQTFYLAFDADWRRKRGVALAMVRLAERLIERGARVLILDWPEATGKGIDDYLQDGGDLSALIRGARPFEAGDFTPYVATPNQRVHDVVAAVEEQMARDDWSKRTGKTDHSNLRALLELATERGRIRDGRLEVLVSTRDLQRRAGIGSRKTLAASTARLVERGYIETVAGDRSRGQSNRYRICPLVNQSNREGASIEHYSYTPGSLTDKFTPHLRWSAPPPPENAPVRISGDALQPSGKVAEMALYLLVRWGGRGTMGDLSRATGVNHTGQLRQALQPLADAGVWVLPPKYARGADAVVALSAGWRRLLDAHRTETGELARNRRQAARHYRDRQGFADRARPADKEPLLPGPEKVADIVEAAAKRQAAAVAARQLQKVGMTAVTFVSEMLAAHGRMRVGLLRDVWRDRGGTPSDIWRAIQAGGYRTQRLPEYGNELFVYQHNGGRE